MIEGKNVILRTFKEEDLEKVFEKRERVLGRGDYYPMDFLSLFKAKKGFQENGNWDPENAGVLLITNKDKEYLGVIAFFKENSQQLGFDIGFMVFDSERRGKGIMTEACKILCAYLFELNPIPRLQATVEVGNIASGRVLEKCGFKKDGVMRKATFNHGEYRDLELYSLLREECSSLKDVL